LADILGERQTVAEGVATASAARALAERLGVEAPITAAVDDVTAGCIDIKSAVAGLLSRPPVQDERA